MLSSGVLRAGRNLAVLAIAAIFFLHVEPALAAFPVDKGLGMQPPASPVQAYIDSFHDALLWIISIISLFVLALLIIVTVRFNKRSNPTPSTTAHNVKLEVIWTIVPAVILLGIALIWSFPLLYYSERMPDKIDLTLKVTAHQWYWSYEYPDNGGINFDSHGIWDSSSVTNEQAAKLIKESEGSWLIKGGKPLRLLEVDNRVVLPVGKTVRVQITSGDVEHSWFMPSMAANRMAVPGKLTELWIKVDREGVYYGQCSMICGNGHAFMPIVIEAVQPEKFAAWVDSKKPKASEAAPKPKQHAQKSEE